MPELQSFLALDYGKKRTGFAVGNRILGTAQPQGTMVAQGDARFVKIAEQIKTWQPDALVLGVPFYPDGADNENTQAVKKFARQLRGRFNLPVLEVDERYSTTEAHSQLHMLPQWPGKQGDQDADAASACIILEQYLRSVA